MERFYLRARPRTIERHTIKLRWLTEVGRLHLARGEIRKLPSIYYIERPRNTERPRKRKTSTKNLGLKVLSPAGG